MMAARVLRAYETRREEEGWLGFFWKRFDKGYSGMEDDYRRALRWSLARPRNGWAVVGGTSLLFLLALFIQVRFGGGEFMPTTDNGMAEVALELPPGTPIERTSHRGTARRRAPAPDSRGDGPSHHHRPGQRRDDVHRSRREPGPDPGDRGLAAPDRILLPPHPGAHGRDPRRRRHRDPLPDHGWRRERGSPPDPREGAGPGPAGDAGRAGHRHHSGNRGARGREEHDPGATS